VGRAAAEGKIANRFTFLWVPVFLEIPATMVTILGRKIY